jgi:hypothetical protein
MSEDKQRSDAQGQKMSWQERETMLALQRLATARANLATLEEAAAPADPMASVDRDDARRADELHAEIEKLRPKTTARFGAGAAKEKIDELDFQLRLVLDRMGFATYEAYRAAAENPVTAADVDATVLELARREFRSAEESFLEIASMVSPPSEPEPAREPEHEFEADVIRLQKPSAAS